MSKVGKRVSLCVVRLFQIEGRWQLLTTELSQLQERKEQTEQRVSLQTSAVSSHSMKLLPYTPTQ